jgi:hypothetical protein
MRRVFLTASAALALTGGALAFGPFGAAMAGPLADGVAAAGRGDYMSLDEWKSLGATKQAVEDTIADRAAAADPAAEV